MMFWIGFVVGMAFVWFVAWCLRRRPIISNVTPSWLHNERYKRDGDDALWK